MNNPTLTTAARTLLRAAGFVAPVVATLELVGGMVLVLGVLSRPIAALLTPNMVGALALVHATAGIFVETGGFELVLLLAAAALAVVLVGPGRLSVDNALFGRKTSKLGVLA